MKQQTTHYETITAWIDSCENESQLDTVGLFVSDKLITDDKQRDDIIDYLHLTIRMRERVAAKVAQRDMVPVQRFPACDEHQPSDIIQH